MDFEEHSSLPSGAEARPLQARRFSWTSTRTPAWLPAPWNAFFVGYLAALGLPAVVALLVWLILRVFPFFALPGALHLLVTLVVALLWGTGPALLATLMGCLLLNVFVLHPSLSQGLSLLQSLIEILIFLLVGVTISLVVSRTEYAREDAELARAQVEQERARAAAQAAELETILATIADGVFVYDADRRVRHTNPAAQAFNPYSTQKDYVERSYPERFEQFQIRDMQGRPMNVEDLPVTRALHGEVLRGAQAVDMMLKTADGKSLLFFNVSGAPILDGADKVRGAVVVTRDVTAQRQSAQRSRDALNALLQFAEALVHAEVTHELELVDVDSEYEPNASLNPVAQRLASLVSRVSGYPIVSLTVLKESTQEPLAAAAYGLTPEQEVAWRERRAGFTIGELIAGTQSNQRLLAGEAVVIDLSKPPFSERPTAYASRKILLAPMMLEGRLLGIVTFGSSEQASDVSEDELALAKALAQLAAITLERARLFQERTQAQAAVLALSETNRLMDEFIGIAGHELRTPLTTVKASVQLARRQVNKMLKTQDRLPTEVTTMVSTIQGHLDRTERQIAMQNRLVSDLLDVARLHSNRLELHPDLCDLAALVSESVEDQRYLAPTRVIELINKTTEEVLVMADADRVRQVIGNYLSNALKYSDADRPVEVCLEVIGRQARIAVQDEGPGLSREQQQHIWERFYRVPDVEVRSGSGVGLGLGLHISRMIVERLGGQVGVDSTPGKGSTFWFTLPLAETNDR